MARQNQRPKHKTRKEKKRESGASSHSPPADSSRAKKRYELEQMLLHPQIEEPAEKGRVVFELQVIRPVIKEPPTAKALALPGKARDPRDVVPKFANSGDQSVTDSRENASSSRSIRIQNLKKELALLNAQIEHQKRFCAILAEKTKSITSMYREISSMLNKE
ncbi:Protein of unknown function [Pyronema omphalodes CBS 100304]|uniref:Uncharacterized protein n=1 Tax=Pyronema omphalodes (strain CBS 100304) TaxID=1076935 RepID=U4LMS0_PYROM|nr:Protein of unknown function [Pyronema omphalodes CBS 100304]